MWPLPPLERELVTFTIYPNALVCSWITPKSPTTAIPSYSGYKHHTLSPFEITHSLVCNPTHIKTLMSDFLTQHNKRNALISLCLAGNQLYHYYLALPTAHPKATDFGIAPSSTTQWGYRFMYHNDEGLAVFYVYKIPKSLLLQYQLIAIAEQLNLISITTNHMALYAAYKAVFGNAFRQSQYALDMMKAHNNAENIITYDALKRMIAIPQHAQKETETSYLATSYGLFMMQGQNL